MKVRTVRSFYVIESISIAYLAKRSKSLFFQPVAVLNYFELSSHLVFTVEAKSKALLSLQMDRRDLLLATTQARSNNDETEKEF
jgi:hypothetical protein